jgi:hypothetical protein
VSGPAATRILTAAALVIGGAAIASVAACGGSSAPRTTQAVPAVLTEHGFGGLRFGRPLATIRKAGLIAAQDIPGCELGSPRPIAARLMPPLTGFATFGGAAPHRLVALQITAGAVTDRGIRIGDPAAKVRRAYPEARVSNSLPPEPLQWAALIVTRAGRDRMWLLLDKPGGVLKDFELPAPQFCE